MEFLKGLISDELYEQLSSALAETDVKLADLSKGEYIAKGKFDSEAKKFKDAQKKYADMQATLDALKTERMTDEERMQAAIQAAEQAQHEFAIKTNRLEAEKLLVAAGLSEADYGELIDNVVFEDAERTKKTVTSLVGILTKVKSDTERDVQDKIAKGTAKPPASTAAPPDQRAAKQQELTDAIKAGQTLRVVQLTRELAEAQNK